MRREDGQRGHEEERWQQGWEWVGERGGGGGKWAAGNGIHMRSLHDSTTSLFANGACQVHSVLPQGI